MAPPRLGAGKKPTAKSQQGRDDNKKRQAPNKQPQRNQADTNTDTNPDASNKIDLSATIPLPLQQLLLNVFKSALLTTEAQDRRNDTENASNEPSQDTAPAQLDIKTLVQTIKSHLYNRDFDSAFTDASDDLLRAYALRWSASRALGYAGVFKSVLRVLFPDLSSATAAGAAAGTGTDHVVCIGGGAGAEITALAAVWRDLNAGSEGDATGLAGAVAGVSLEGEGMGVEGASSGVSAPRLKVTTVDIADWSSVVDRLARTFRSAAVPASKACPAPLQRDEAGDFVVGFRRADVLSLSEGELGEILHPDAERGGSGSGSEAPVQTVMVTLMFTLNELFSTSMAKTTAFLLRMTDLLRPGTVLLVVDSPGSYSTLTLGKAAKKDADTAGDATGAQERRYPMKFLLDHTLLSVAVGRWEKIYSQDSRWWRRDAARLRYYVGEGAGLEDMRFQVHVYRRLGD
ncbi:25S rRNA (uracil2843-N3)-methyltransferase [Aspergillus clavatus NRRL 1]|uniref:25S rRNA (Uridine(2843)-N(3))-methyltransferase n=1 Tax=Aspergillus clavatus (strain ATCC 1007 / CBS 513.65 / DSM 816 / NCTC 3887 / NRRL 1 / QM 1276 / 107) TaxID=344612 RepID=A1CPB2_ASPCL|nr:uncharacterized protein ACLA_021970 [Aspergillus clavatus NRRL 1]EAW07483.1 conserved hypothetical protein [Aspergillus clavatus NRRL 1]